MSKFRVYYSDGSTFDGPGKPPAWDVQIILQKNEEGQIVARSGKDYYVLRDGVWIEVDFVGLIDYLQATGLVLFGRTIANGEFAKILEKALADREKFFDD